MREWQQDIAFIALAIFAAAGLTLVGPEHAYTLVSALKSLVPGVA